MDLGPNTLMTNPQHLFDHGRHHQSMAALLSSGRRPTATTNRLKMNRFLAIPASLRLCSHSWHKTQEREIQQKEETLPLALKESTQVLNVVTNGSPQEKKKQTR